MKTKVYFIIILVVLILTAPSAQGIQKHSKIQPWLTNYIWNYIPAGTSWDVVNMLNNNSFSNKNYEFKEMAIKNKTGIDSLGTASQASKYFINSYLIEKDEMQSLENWMINSALFRNVQNTFQFDESEEENKIELAAWMNNNQSWLKPDK